MFVAGDEITPGICNLSTSIRRWQRARIFVRLIVVGFVVAYVSRCRDVRVLSWRPGIYVCPLVLRALLWRRIANNLLYCGRCGRVLSSFFSWSNGGAGEGVGRVASGPQRS